jgi:hypothetical protein
MNSMHHNRDDHVFRKGYYMGSAAVYVCVVCGAEALPEELDDAPVAVPPTGLAATD